MAVVAVLMLSPCLAHAQDTSRNFVRTVTMLNAGGTDSLQAVQYYNAWDTRQSQPRINFPVPVIHQDDTIYSSYFSEVELQLFHPYVYKSTVLKLTDEGLVMQDLSGQLPQVVLPKSVSDSILYCLYHLYVKKEPKILAKKKREGYHFTENHSLRIDVVTKEKKARRYKEDYWGSKDHYNLIIDYSKPLNQLFDLVIKATFQYNKYCQIMNSDVFEMRIDTLYINCDTSTTFLDNRKYSQQIILTLRNKTNLPIWLFLGPYHPDIRDFSLTDPYRWNGKTYRNLPIMTNKRLNSLSDDIWKSNPGTWLGDFLKIIEGSHSFCIVLHSDKKNDFDSLTFFDITDFIYMFTPKQMEQFMQLYRIDEDKLIHMSYPHDVIVIPWEYIRDLNPYI